LLDNWHKSTSTIIGPWGEERDMTNADCIRVLSVDDHPLFREGVANIINCQSDMSLVRTASDGREGSKRFAR
jgi:hypothetical protein